MQITKSFKLDRRSHEHFNKEKALLMRECVVYFNKWPHQLCAFLADMYSLLGMWFQKVIQVPHRKPAGGTIFPKVVVPSAQPVIKT